MCRLVMLSMNFTLEWAETRSPAAAPAAYLCDKAWCIISTQESRPLGHGVTGQRQGPLQVPGRSRHRAAPCFEDPITARHSSLFVGGETDCQRRQAISPMSHSLSR